MSFHTQPFETDEQRLQAAQLANEERQLLVETLLVKYNRFEEAYDFIERFHRPVANGSHRRGQIGGILGDSRSGKTSVCSYYRHHHPMQTTEEGERYPVVYIEATDIMRPLEMAAAIMRQTSSGPGLPSRISIAAALDLAFKRLVMARTELLIIDDAQFMLLSKNKGNVHRIVGFLKLLADQKSASILLSGTAPIAEFVDSIDYLRGRGGFPRKALKSFEASGPEFDEFRLLLNEIDDRLPFTKTSGFYREQLAREFYRYSDGMIGRVMNLVRDAAYLAINGNTANIQIEHLRRVADERLAHGERAYFQ